MRCNPTVDFHSPVFTFTPDLELLVWGPADALIVVTTIHEQSFAFTRNEIMTVLTLDDGVTFETPRCISLHWLLVACIYHV